MTTAEYTALTGIPVTAANTAMITAQINRSRLLLEALLGYSLDDPDANQYIELGKTKSEMPCPDDVDMDDLDPADDVVYAYRLYSYHKDDTYLAIDPCTAVHAVKLVKDGVTYKTLDPDDYRLQWKNGLVKFLAQDNCWCWCEAGCLECCENVQLAVDADWLGKTPPGYPEDILGLWADMVTYYSNPKNGIKSETLGPHSYTRFDNTSPQDMDSGSVMLKKYVGPNGSLFINITL